MKCRKCFIKVGHVRRVTLSENGKEKFVTFGYSHLGKFLKEGIGKQKVLIGICRDLILVGRSVWVGA